jgi:hypothetical protein
VKPGGTDAGGGAKPGGTGAGGGAKPGGTGAGGAETGGGSGTRAGDAEIGGRAPPVVASIGATGAIAATEGSIEAADVARALDAIAVEEYAAATEAIGERKQEAAARPTLGQERCSDTMKT